MWEGRLSSVEHFSLFLKDFFMANICDAVAGKAEVQLVTKELTAVHLDEQVPESFMCCVADMTRKDF